MSDLATHELTDAAISDAVASLIGEHKTMLEAYSVITGTPLSVVEEVIQQLIEDNIDSSAPISIALAALGRTNVDITVPLIIRENHGMRWGTPRAYLVELDKTSLLDNQYAVSYVRGPYGNREFMTAAMTIVNEDSVDTHAFTEEAVIKGWKVHFIAPILSKKAGLA